MMRIIALALLLSAPLVHADLFECDAKKAARNAAMDATVGVSGRCDPEKLVEDKKEGLVEGIDDKVDIDLDRDGKKDRKDDGDGLLKRNKDD